VLETAYQCINHFLGSQSQEEEEEGIQLGSTGQQSSSTQAAFNGTVTDKDHKDDYRENAIQVVEPIAEQGMGQSVEIVVKELPPVSCTSSADELVKPTFVSPSVWYLNASQYLDFIKDTISDPPILPFPPILTGPGEMLQVL